MVQLLLHLPSDHMVQFTSAKESGHCTQDKTTEAFYFIFCGAEEGFQGLLYAEQALYLCVLPPTLGTVLRLIKRQKLNF